MKKNTALVIAGLLGALLLIGTQSASFAQGTLSIGGSQAHFGTHSLRAGFMPDPKVIQVTSGGNLDVSRMGYGSSCRGHATATPDAILNYQGSSSANFLRFYVQASGDTTLVINDASGTWHCNDDSVGLNPMVSIQNAPSGQYDIWVGSYAAGEQISGTLNITELRSNQPRP